VTQDYLLGIDVGTSVVKAALFDRAGREIAVNYRRNNLYHPQPGWSEADMEETWETTVAVIRELLQTSRIAPAQIAAVGLCGNMIGAWLVDAQGQPVRRAILWNDGRTRTVFEALEHQRSDFMSYVFNFSGSVLEHGCTLPVVRWLADHEPESLRRATALLHAKDWIRYKLTGQLHTDVSEVPGAPGDVRQRHLFTPFVTSETIIGEIQPEAAEKTCLLAGTPVAAGAGDVPSVALGVGAVEVGVACSILGTHCINGLVLDQPHFEPPDVGILFTIPGERWMRALANVAGTTNLDWFINQFCADMRSSPNLFDQLEMLASQSPAGSRGILYHPYLSSVGIIAPFFEPAARAQFFGLTPEHTRADILRSVYEGVALAIRDCYNAIQTEVSEIRLSGGGARSRLWSQIIADTMGTRVLVPAGSEFGAKGAALLAGVGIGWFSSIGEAAKATLNIQRIHEPDLTLKPLYDANYDIYCQIREVMRPVWQKAALRVI
jgi:sugar (pentulose or hexulose) kinase